MKSLVSPAQFSSVALSLARGASRKEEARGRKARYIGGNISRGWNASFYDRSHASRSRTVIMLASTSATVRLLKPLIHSNVLQLERTLVAPEVSRYILCAYRNLSTHDRVKVSDM